MLQSCSAVSVIIKIIHYAKNDNINSAKWDDVKTGTGQLDSRPIYSYGIQDRSLDVIASNCMTEHNFKKRSIIVII